VGDEVMLILIAELLKGTGGMGYPSLKPAISTCIQGVWYLFGNWLLQRGMKIWLQKRRR
jgi:hypothetical protein